VKKTATVLGLGDSGEAAAELLLALGYDVCAVDAQAGEAVRRRAARLTGAGVQVAVAAAALPAGRDRADLAVLSPGVPAEHPWALQLAAGGSPVISELELGWRHCRSSVLAVTGSSGKSTLVKFCAEALANGGFTTAAGANYGPPLSRLVRLDPPPDWIVAEVSSFQLEAVDTFRPRVGILLNVHPNHLDRHPDFETYRRLKLNLFRRMQKGDDAVVPEELLSDLADLPGSGSGGPRRITFGPSDTADSRWLGGAVALRLARRSGRIDFRGSHFDNDVLGLSAAAAVAALRCIGVRPAAIERTAMTFEPLPHRMTRVVERDGVRYIDDSKATTLAALCAGVAMAGGPVRLIAGGLLKEKSADWAKERLAKQVRRVYLIGKDADVLREAWCDAVDCLPCGTLETAVENARRDARPGEVVLLSPGCASFDQFSGYAERGTRFAALASGIEQGGETK
jgi:UDP-N-acetylmuramoylalanine--D-glutamate ligase